ncbi:MAG: DMT family transporter [Halanaerobiales bacterium]|nr:DMT family transporter [Halanaerobiales bacterium]
MNKILPYISGLLFSTIFGFSFMYTKEALEIIGPFQLMGYRFLVAALLVNILWLLGVFKISVKLKKVKYLFIIALAQPILYFVFETTGMNYTTSSEAGLLISLIPVVVTILAIFFLNEIPGKKQTIYIVLSVAGVIFITIMKSSTEISGNFLGMALIGGAVIMAGIYNIMSRKMSVDFKPEVITYFMMTIAAVVFNIILLSSKATTLSNYIDPLTDLKVLIPVIYLGVLSSVLAFFFVNYTLSKLPASQSAVFANLTTVVSILAGVFIRNEPFYWFQIVGAVLIIIGVWGTNYYGKIKQQETELKG